MNECFIISAPRAGSTLLQRLLANHEEIATTGESWLALPLAYSVRRDGVLAEYNHHSYHRGAADFMQHLPGRESEFLAEAGQMLNRLHEKAGPPESRYFLDKTPRYYLILHELAGMFPQGKFILLHRNPLAVAASIFNTWKGGRLRLKGSLLDLYLAPRQIAEFASRREADLMEVRYEELVRNPLESTNRILKFLGLSPLSRLHLPEKDAVTTAALGDKTGIHAYREVSTAPLEKWAGFYNTPLRRAWARQYLAYLGPDVLKRCGCTAAGLLQALPAGTSWKSLVQDLWDLRWKTFTLLCGNRVQPELKRARKMPQPALRWVWRLW